MSNVFGSTDSMLQNLSQARSQLEDAKVNVLEDKEKPELIGKTLGEAKTFITGSSIVKAVGPKLKKFVIQKVKGRVEQAKGQLESKVKNALKGKPKPPAEEPAAAEPVAPVEPVAEDLPFGASAEEINEAAGRATIKASGEAVAKGLPKGAGGATQGGDIESLAASDTPLTTSQASQFTSTPELGAQTTTSGGIGETSFGTSAATETSTSASGGLAETSFGAAGRDAASQIGTESSSITEESMNAGRAGLGESGISDTLNAIGRGAGKLLDGARQIIFGARQAATGAAKTVAKQAGETAAKVGGAAAEEGGTVAGGETALGILDAIPGADVIGVIGGAILTGIEAHKHNKLAKSIRNAASGIPNFSVSTQIGSFGQ